jgi:hypothetical protein
MNIGAFIDVFRYGGQLADKDKWTTGQISASVLAGFLAGCLHIIEMVKPEWKLPITSAQLDLVAGAFVTIINVCINIAKSDRHGILPPKPTPVIVPEPSEPPRQQEGVQPVVKANSSATRQPNLDSDLYRG